AKFGSTTARTLVELIQRTELNRVRRTGLGARRLQPALQPVVAQRAFVRLAVVDVQLDDAERTRRNTVPAAVADVLLDHHSTELRSKQGPSRARFQAAGASAVFAYIAHHQPVALERLHLCYSYAAVVCELFDKAD